MWSYQQFVAKHAAKYAGLSAAAKRTRYNQYVASQRGNPSTSAKRRPRARPGNPRRPRRSRRSAGASAISPQVAPFVRMVSNPFVTSGSGLPVFPAPPSQKITTWVKGTFTVGSNGVGFVHVQPLLDAGTINVNYSTNAYTGLNAAAAGTTGTGGVAVTGNNQYTAAQFTANVTLQQRLVCAGIRLRYTGTQNNQSGTMMAFVHPEHNTVVGFVKADFLAFEGVDFQPVSRQWSQAVWIPTHRTELEYFNQPGVPNQYSGALTAAGAPICCFVPDGLPGNTYDYEYYQHHEVIGTNAVDKTPNPISSQTEPILSRLRGSVQNYAGRAITNGTGAAARNLIPLSLTDTATRLTRYALFGGDL